MATAGSGGMRGKRVLITGGTDGIGKATAVGLVRMGASVVIVGRSRLKGEAAVADVLRESGWRDGEAAVDLMPADLSSQASVRQLVEDYVGRYGRLDVLVNNAGVTSTKRTETEDGLETTFAVNHLAPFLLTNLLLDALKRSASARVVNVASGLERRGAIDFDDLQGEKRYSGFRAYNNSKLAMVLFTYELARRLDGTGVTANCLEPGGVATSLGRDTTGPFKLFLTAMRPFMATPEAGAETTIHLASSPEVEGVSGRYFAKKTPSKTSRTSYDEAIARRLWSVSAELTGLARRADSAAAR